MDALQNVFVSMHEYDKVGTILVISKTYAAAPRLTITVMCSSNDTGPQSLLRTLVISRLLQEFRIEGKLVQKCSRDPNRAAPKSTRNRIGKARPPLLQRTYDDQLPSSLEGERNYILPKGARTMGMRQV